ncbi:hypothetical protein NL676_038373 [Syzygium grande]|nr:hypothetical protein NL676_038373 [Syzygium grande]
MLTSPASPPLVSQFLLPSSRSHNAVALSRRRNPRLRRRRRRTSFGLRLPLAPAQPSSASLVSSLQLAGPEPPPAFAVPTPSSPTRCRDQVVRAHRTYVELVIAQKSTLA